MLLKVSNALALGTDDASDLAATKKENARLEAVLHDLEGDIQRLRTDVHIDGDSETLARELSRRLEARGQSRRQNELLRYLHASEAVQSTNSYLRGKLALARRKEALESQRAELALVNEEIERKERLVAVLQDQR